MTHPAETTPTTPDSATDPTAGEAHRWARPAMGVVGVLAAALILYVGVAWFVGMPGPGFVRRYPASELDRLATQLNRSAVPTVDSCSRQTQQLPVAHVDHLRSRVVLDIGAAPPSLPEELRDMIIPDDDHPRFQTVICDFSQRVGR